MKKVLNNYYVHKSNYNELSETFRESEFHPYIAIAVAYCDKYFPNYEVIKYDSQKQTISCIESPDWNTANEPIVGDSLVTNLITGEVKIIKGRTKNPQIYHNKWMFVDESYTGFDVQAARERTKLWNSIDNIDKKRIGNQDYWFLILDANGIER